MDAYHDLLKDILLNGREHSDKANARRVFGRQFRHDMQKGFPLVTTKKMFFRGVFEELAWFLSGSTSLHDLDESVHRWWAPWADKDGSLGPIYGEQLRDYGGEIDQLHSVVSQIIEEPKSRRIVMTTWNPLDVPDMRLPCCHGLVTQFCCEEDGGLSLSTYQRSADMFIGFPVNIASYGLLLELVAQATGRWANELIISIGDAHIYECHFHLVEEQLTRTPFSLPRLDIHMQQGDTADEALENILNLGFEDIELHDYFHFPALKGKLVIV